MRRLVFVPCLTLVAAVWFTALPAFAGEMKILSEEQVTQLEARAQGAEPREQCFLYAEIIAQMTERVDVEIAAGDLEKASAHLNRLNDYTAVLHNKLSGDSKKLKEAEILIRHTTVRMNGMVHAASYDNREALHTVEAKLGSLESEMMLHVFKR